MSINMGMAITLLWQGMAGIFTVLIVIALIVTMLARLDRNSTF